MSKNCEVFKTVEERVVAFQNWCKNAPQQDCANTECTECQFKWLELENLELESKDSVKKKFTFTSMADAREAFHHFCDAHSTDGSTLECDCPFNGNIDCFSSWLERKDKCYDNDSL